MSTLLATASPQPQRLEQERPQRIPTLDGWRGIAILLVLADHVQYGLYPSHEIILTGGHGVAIFFVLSGYLITSKLRDEFQQTGSLDLKHFYIRRFFRLMPAAWAYLLVLVLVSRHMGLAIGRHTIVACLLFYRNFHKFIDAGYESLFTGHFWSLSIEEQFYLLWPSILLLLGFRRSRYFALVVAGIVAVLRLHNWSTLMTLESLRMMETQYRADALFIGCAAALSIPLLSKFVRGWMVMPLLALLILCISKYSMLIPLWESSAIALLLFSTSTYSDSVIGRALQWKPLAYVGTISYSLYLWQQPFLSTPTGRRTIAAERLAALAVIAILSHHCLEIPMIKLGRRLRSLGEPVEAAAGR